MKLAAVLLGIFTVLATQDIASAGDDKCTAYKILATGNKAFAKLKCHGKAANTGVTVDPECITKAETKFAEKFAKAETKPPCFATGDAAAVEAKVDAFVADIETDLRPSLGESKCAGKKLKATGKKAFKKLKCHKKATTKGLVVDPLCLSAEETKFNEKFADAEGLDDCLTTGDAAAIEIKVDAFVDDAATELRPVTPTRCTPEKLRETGDKTRAKLRCYSLAVEAGSVPDPPCLSDAETKFNNGFTNAESFGDCLAPGGDAAAIEAKVDALIVDVLAELAPGSGPSSCTADKLYEAGRKADRKLLCYGKAFRYGHPLNPACLAAAESHFSESFLNAEGKNDCLAPPGDAAAIEGKIDAFIADVTGELLP